MFLTASLGRFGRAFRSRNYSIYCAGSTLTLIGLWMQRIAVGWMAWDLTHSPTWLGAVAFAELFPVVILSPIAGTVADRFDRLKVARISQILMMIQAFILTYLVFSESLTIYLLTGLSLYAGIVVSFWQPARLTLIPNLVPKEDLTSAIATNAVIFNTARFVGPAIAGVVIHQYGVGYAFLANALSYISFIIALYLITPREDAKRSYRQGFLTDAVEGMKYAANHPGIGPCLILMAVTCIGIRGVFELFPGFADAVFDRGAEGLSYLAASVGIGAVLSGLYLGQREGLAGLTQIQIWSVALQAIAIAGFAVTDNFALALIAAGLFGAGMSLHGSSAQALIQSSVAGYMRGRVLALYGMLFRGGPAVGALAMGAAAETFGLQMPALIGAIIGFAAFAWVSKRKEKLQNALEVSEAPGD